MAKFTVVSEDGRTQELHPLISEAGELIWQGREVVCIREGALITFGMCEFARFELGDRSEYSTNHFWLAA